MAKFKGLVKSCECCGAEFKVPQCQAHVRTCSRDCGYKIRHVANKKDKVQLKCVVCGGLFLEHPSHADRRSTCSVECRDKNPELVRRRSENFSGSSNPSWKGGVMLKTVSASGRSYSRQNPEIENERSARRRLTQAGATPAWANLDKIREFYAARKRVTKITGRKYHVDHIIPLKSDLVCGLHVEFNLRLLEEKPNLSKANRTWPDMW